MNILVISTKFIESYPPALAVRLGNILNLLKRNDNNITYIAFYTDDNELQKIETESKYYNKVIPVKLNRKMAYLNAFIAFFQKKPMSYAYFNSKEMKKAIKKELSIQDYNLIYVNTDKMVQFVENYNTYVRVADFCDAAPLNFYSQAKYLKNLLKKIYAFIEGKRQYKYEKRYIDILDKVFFISDYDRKYMTDSSHINKTMVIPITIDTNKFYNPNPTNYNLNEIIYLGLMSYIANHDAVLYFIKEIFPLIKIKNPNAIFKIVGGNPRKELLDISKNDSSIVITGWVDDVREHIRTACVSAATVRIGAGIQNKILETMSMGIPTVTTEFGAGGITNDASILPVAKTPKDFAERILEIMNNQSLRNEISKNSRNFCENHFTNQDYMNQIDKIQNEFLNRTNTNRYCIVSSCHIEELKNF